MAKIYKRGKVWYITYYQDGKRYRRSIGRDKKKAEAVLKEVEYKLSKGIQVSERKIKLDDYVNEFLDYIKARNQPKTHFNYSIALDHFRKYLKQKEGVKYLSDVNMGMIDRYISYRLNSPSPKRKNRPIDKSTVNTEIKAIKRFFNRAVELNYLITSPAKNVKLLRSVKKTPRFFSETEIEMILRTCKDEWVRNVYLTLLYTGMRIGELANLEWEDVDFEKRVIRIRVKDHWAPKGREEREIPMHDVVFYILLNTERKSRWVFTKADGGKINIHSLEDRFRNHLKRLGIRNATLHTWRHTFASYIVMRTGNIRAVQKLLGHKSIKTTEIYSHLSEKHLYHIVHQLPGPKMGTILGTVQDPEIFKLRKLLKIKEWAMEDSNLRLLPCEDGDDSEKEG